MFWAARWNTAGQKSGGRVGGSAVYRETGTDRGAENNDTPKHSEIKIDEVVRVIKMLKGLEEK